MSQKHLNPKNNKKCEKQKSQFEPIRPWDVKVNPYLSEVVGDLLEDILKRYVNIWYDFISGSPVFVTECKSSLRHGSAILYHRINQGEWALLKSKTLPKIISQISFFIDKEKLKESFENF